MKDVISAQARLCFINIHDNITFVKAVPHIQRWLFKVNVQHRKSAVVLILSSLFLSLLLLGARTGYSTDDKANLDVFTQKTRFSGRGANVRSDAFGPQELVVLYALVTYDTIPVNDLLVLFQVTLPDQTDFSLTAQTNSTGIASVNFTIMTPPANTSSNGIFGDWQVRANALVNSEVVSDALVFTVDWIVKLLSLKPIDGTLAEQSSFGIGGDIGFELDLRNIAMTVKNATITMTLKDELNTPFVNATIVNLVQPNDTVTTILLRFQIPKFASIGEASAEANALTALASQGGVAYCPNVTANFSITTGDPLAIALHDVALISISSSARSLQIGQPLTLTLQARNEGTEPESFNVTAYFADLAVGTEQVVDLLPYSTVDLNFTVDTSVLALGTYVPAGSTPVLPNEADVADDTITGQSVDIVAQAPSFIHDIGITSLDASASMAHVGEIVQVNVTVSNEGNATESFNVSAHYDLVLIGTIEVVDLQPLNAQALSFMWDTTGLNKTTYQIGAAAPLAGDADSSDNVLVDGSVTLTEPLASYFGVNWFDGFLIFGIILLAALIVALLLLRRSRKKID